MMGFLDLPAEIRVQIYGCTINPDIGPCSDYDGLYHSCRLIKQETDFECARLLRSSLVGLESPLSTVDGLRFDIPETFTALRNLRISVRNYRRFQNDFIELLKPLFALHIDSLTILHHPDDKGTLFDEDNIKWMINEIAEKPIILNARRVVFVLPFMSSRCASSLLTKMGPTRMIHQMRKTGWLLLPGSCASLVIINDDVESTQDQVEYQDLMAALQGYGNMPRLERAVMMAIVCVIFAFILKDVAQIWRGDLILNPFKL